jgi:DNA gyrase subunit A
VVITTTKGQTIRFKSKDIRLMGRNAVGVRAIKLKSKDVVKSADVAKDYYHDPVLLVLTKNGYGKKTSLSEYKVQKRGGSGIKTASLTEKTGEIIVARVVEEERQLISVSKKCNVILLTIEEVPRLGRQTQGVRIMKLRKGDSVAAGVCF